MDAQEYHRNPLTAWKTELVADLERVASRDRWGLALMGVGWVHLAFFGVCQALYSNGDRESSHFLPLWALEFVANLWVIRRVAGPGWHRATPLAPVLVRVWATFLILSFNVASLNSLMGWHAEWFKAVWTTLSTFGFATTAYLVNLGYFVPAVQMYFTGLLMVRFPGWEYLIYGVSWWIALEAIGLILETRRARGPADDADRATSDSLAEVLVEHS